MDELRSEPDEPNDGAGDRAGRWDAAARGDAGRGDTADGDAAGRDAGAVRQRVEPRSRAEYAADLEQRAAGRWAEVAVRAPVDDALRRFEPVRAGLPEVSGRDAAAYIERCRVNEAYWAKNPHGPFATLIAVAATYCHPESYDGAYSDLIDRAQSPEPDDDEIRVFKAELQQALADPGQLPDDELFKAVDYGDGSDERFLRRLWDDLYGGEPA